MSRTGIPDLIPVVIPDIGYRTDGGGEPGDKPMIDFKVNDKSVSSDSDPQRPLLWVLREDLELTGTKFSCGLGQCGSCTVLLDGQPVRSCITPVATVEHKSVTTVEGLGAKSAVVAAWREHSVPQCGYCQSGQLMAATALLDKHPQPDDDQIDAAMSRQLCRCGTYPRIRAAIKTAAEIIGQEAGLA